MSDKILKPIYQVLDPALTSLQGLVTFLDQYTWVYQPIKLVVYFLPVQSYRQYIAIYSSESMTQQHRLFYKAWVLGVKTIKCNR